MVDFPIVQETDVLIATTVFLVQRGVKPYQFSIPRGQGIDSVTPRERLERAFESFGFQPTFSSQGADIIAVSESEWWHIECKGAGSGKPQTHRNNFDRALSSVVSYYGADRDDLPDDLINSKQILGLALPASPIFLHQLQKRVRKPLRQRLDLWVLLYEPNIGAIKSISPNEDY